MERERTEQFVLRRWWLTIARTHEGNDSGWEQCRDMKAEKRYRILSTFQVESKKTILKQMELRGSEVDEQGNCVYLEKSI